jgi:hypothetical protein
MAQTAGGGAPISIVADIVFIGAIILLHRPVPPGPNGLRYLDYFLGLLADSGLDTGAKMEVIALISGFASCIQRLIDVARPGDPVGRQHATLHGLTLPLGQAPA